MTLIKQLLILSIFSLAACSPQQNSSTLSYPESESPGAVVLKDRCGECHAAPQPASRTAQQWISILYRMQDRMRSKHIEPLDKNEFSTLRDYLQKHASK